MILDIVKSNDDVSIRLTDERWEHILEQHPEMSGYYERMLRTVENPMFVLRAHHGSKNALNNFGRKRWFHVLYREINRSDGFIISAYFKSDYDENLVI